MINFNHLFIVVLLTSATIGYGQKKPVQQNEKPLPRVSEHAFQFYLVDTMARAMIIDEPVGMAKGFEITLGQTNRLEKLLDRYRVENAEHIQAIVQLQEKISLFKGTEDFQKKGLTPRQKEQLASLERKLEDELKKHLPRWMSMFQTILHPIQLRRFRETATHITTWKFLKENHRVHTLIDDQFLLWPAWIAESAGYQPNLVDKLKKEGKQEQKKLKKLLKRKRKDLLNDKNLKKLTLNKNQSMALFQFVKTVRKTKTQQQHSVLSDLLSNNALQKTLELSPKQQRKIKQALAPYRRSPQTESNQLNKNTITSHNTQMIEEISKTFSPTQRQHIRQRIRKATISESCRELDPDYQALAELVYEQESQPNLEARYREILFLSQRLERYEAQLRQSAVKRILKKLSTDKVDSIQNRLGKRDLLVAKRYHRYYSLEERFGSNKPESLENRPVLPSMEYLRIQWE